MAKRYFPVDVHQITVAETGHTHKRGKNDEHLTIDCPSCDEHLERYGGVTALKAVALTYDQQVDADEKKAEAERAVPEIAHAFADMARRQVAGERA